MSTITTKQQQAIRDKLATIDDIPTGLGDEEAACSVAAINLALSGELTDTIPECMSIVVGKWIIAIQDRMPSEIRNSKEWRELLPLAAGTCRELEAERLKIIMEWMWDSLRVLQPIADDKGFGKEWEAMLAEKTDAAVRAAYAAAYAAACAAYAAACAAADAAYAARAARAARAAADAARAAARAAYAADATDAWDTINPTQLLKQLIEAK